LHDVLQHLHDVLQHLHDVLQHLHDVLEHFLDVPERLQNYLSKFLLNTNARLNFLMLKSKHSYLNLEE
jgi:hypothetical protein